MDKWAEDVIPDIIARRFDKGRMSSVLRSAVNADRRSRILVHFSQFNNYCHIILLFDFKFDMSTIRSAHAIQADVASVESRLMAAYRDGLMEPTKEHLLAIHGLTVIKTIIAIFNCYETADFASRMNFRIY